MPLDSAVGFSAAMQTLVLSGQFKALDTLTLVFQDGTARHYSTELVTGVNDVGEFGDSITFRDKLRDTGTLDESLTLDVDSIDVAVENVRGDVSAFALGQARGLNGARAIVGTLFVSLAGTKYWQEVGRGVVTNASDPDPDARLTVVLDLSAPGPVVADRALQQHCTVPKFGGPGCGSTDADGSAICTRLLTGTDGCRDHAPSPVVTEGEGNEARFQGFVYRITPLNGDPMQDPKGSIDRGGDFNTYRDERVRAGQYVGRHRIPKRPLD
jgi:hypothetical protein